VKRAMKTGRNWKRRYFVLRNTTLCYFKTDQDLNSPRGEIPITSNTFVKESTYKKFSIELSTNRQVIVMCADTLSRQKEWLDALTHSIGLARTEIFPVSSKSEETQFTEEESKSNGGGSVSRATRLFNRLTTRRKSAESPTEMEVDQCSNFEAPPIRRSTYTFVTPATTFEVDRRYKFIKPVGTGAYGVVVSALDTEVNEKVAIKKVTRAFEDLVDAKRILREIKLLRHFDHENIIHVKDVLPPKSMETFEDIYIVSELMETDLHRVIYSKQKLSDDHIQYFVYQILRALKYIHSANVLHRDLKPSNLLLNSNCDLKICDFGLARGLEDTKLELTEYVVTRWYRAPEIMLACREYTKAIDVWAVGCIFAELLGRKPLFPGEDYIHQLQLITDVLGTPEEADLDFIKSEKAKRFMRNLPIRKPRALDSIYADRDPAALDLINQMLKFHPNKRITVDDALKHPYLASLHQPEDEPVHDKMFLFEDVIPDDDLEKSEIQNDILKEVLSFHPEEEHYLKPIKLKSSKNSYF